VGAPEGTRRCVMHLDVDAFLASVEQAVHPELRGRPVVVGGLPHERNLVMSCTYDLRARGVRPGMSLAEAARLCPRAVFRRGDSQAANRLRRELTRLLQRVSPRVEVASIDDFFLDYSGCERLEGRAFERATRLREEIRHELHLPVTIGIARNRTLARLAGRLAKPGGVAELWPGKERAFLRALPVEELPGVGHRTRRLLERFGVRTVGDLELASRELLFASFGSHGLRLYERARGIDEDPVEASPLAEGPDGQPPAPRRSRSIQRVSTFEPEEASRERVEAMLAYLVERAARELRAQRLVARSMEVSLLHVDTRPAAQRRIDPGGEPALVRKRCKLPSPSDATDELGAHARGLLRSLPRRRALIRRVGLSLLELGQSAGWQGSLFSPHGDPDASAAAADRPADQGGSRRDRQRRLDAAVDALRARHGFGRLLRGESAALLGSLELGPDGFRLRTPSLNQ
jgi:DNA polymerase-4